MKKLTPKQEANELIDKINGYTFEDCKNNAITCVERNIEMFTELVNRMDDFSNESRQVVWQLIENEEDIKQELIK